MGDWITEEEAGAFAEALLEAGANTGRPRRHPEKHAAGLGLPLGPHKSRQAHARIRRRPGRSGSRTLGTSQAWAEKRGYAEIIELLRKHGG